LQSAGTFSDGKQQMLALGKALMSNPKLIMLDEPSLGLAPLVVESIISVTLLAELLTPGITLEKAKQIQVLVFICFGERDMSLNPHLEPSTYPLSTDVTLYILKGSAHCHNFASSRHLLCDRLSNWIETHRFFIKIAEICSFSIDLRYRFSYQLKDIFGYLFLCFGQKMFEFCFRKLIQHKSACIMTMYAKAVCL
jgi:hypothetical protein